MRTERTELKHDASNINDRGLPCTLPLNLCSSLRRVLFALAVLGALSAGEVQAQRGLDLRIDTLTQSVLIHPPIDASGDAFSLTTREHTYRSQLGLGDQLARDFTIQKVGEDGVPRAYRPGTAGTQNEDWYGWRRDVLVPFESTVIRVAEPDTVNPPGTMNREAQPGLVAFEDKDAGITIIYGHVREIGVEEGETVQAGAVVAKVGNNGNSRAPHVHIGAWDGEMDLLGAKQGGTPLQIQVDLYAQQRHAPQESGGNGR